ncbi:MAG: hypothetical protein HY323_09070 [Betaproteobacteria bacterium]|nr:hypothetical protein [Betaproteobacteria bacterium]
MAKRSKAEDRLAVDELLRQAMTGVIERLDPTRIEQGLIWAVEGLVRQAEQLAVTDYSQLATKPQRTSRISAHTAKLALALMALRESIAKQAGGGRAPDDWLKRLTPEQFGQLQGWLAEAAARDGDRAE